MTSSRSDGIEVFALPPARPGALEALLDRRCSTRAFAEETLPMSALSQILWAGYGRRSDGGSVVPSAHDLRLLSIYVVAGNVQGLSAGIYRYQANEHGMAITRSGDHREVLAQATLADADWISAAPALVVITGDLVSAQTHFADQRPHGARGQRYVWLEAGHASENMYLAAAELGLAAVLVGGFADDDVARTLDRPTSPAGVATVPLGIFGIGLPMTSDVHRCGTSASRSLQ